MKCDCRFFLHLAPASDSWLNPPDRWFREIADRRIRRGVYKGVTELIAAIEAYIPNTHSDPRPCVCFV